MQVGFLQIYKMKLSSYANKFKIVALPAGIITAEYMKELEKRTEKRESNKDGTDKDEQ